MNEMNRIITFNHTQRVSTLPLVKTEPPPSPSTTTPLRRDSSRLYYNSIVYISIEQLTVIIYCIIISAHTARFPRALSNALVNIQCKMTSNFGSLQLKRCLTLAACLMKRFRMFI